ncbi:hypothetical protein BHE97_00025 [Aeromicrobium sp. PE09-221]|uniref:hypothetical protein n=1 Tax=Aeromicrobium sp. PE09-221 TaxID=1898043 RepID=UPI000B3E764E|nr:hypothetical protein [Aeromicrobium sp. PE09-221]OUZ12892.1 hypothetical protein BHE97_00025 [Aeromicrobium sp. PE09-221]
MDEDEKSPSPAESWAIIDAQRRQVREDLNADDRILYGIWGVAWGLGYLAMFLTVGDRGEPTAIGGGVFAGLLIAALIVTIVHSERRARGLGGAGGRMNTRLGTAWAVTFGATFFIYGGMFSHGLEGEGVGVVTNALPCLIVACLFMGSGAAWNDTRQYRLGIWIAASVAIASVIGVPYLHLVMAVLGGGGFLAAAFLAHRDRRQA